MRSDWRSFCGRGVGVARVILLIRIRRREIWDLTREASEARGRYSDATREVGRLDADLTAMQAILHASEEETALALAEAANAHARAAGAFLIARASICFYFRSGCSVLNPPCFRFGGGGGCGKTA
jgi:hypothetical protein